MAVCSRRYIVPRPPRVILLTDISVHNAARRSLSLFVNLYSASSYVRTVSDRTNVSLYSLICTTVTEKPDVTFVKGGLFRGAGFEFVRPFKEQWWRRAETWERAYVSGDNLSH